jgi:Type II secretion system protein C
MTRLAKLERQPKRNLPLVLVSVLGGGALAWLISWETGLDTFKLWQRGTAPRPVGVVKAPVAPPMKAIGVTPPTPKGNDSSISPVPLKLLLVSVHPGRSPTEGTAQIGVDRETPQTYQAGAMLENGAHIAELHTDYVLLKKAGRSMQLFLDSRAHPANGANLELATVGGVKAAPITAIARDVLTAYMRPSPKYDGDMLVGYQVYPGANSGPFGQMGLQGGDVIVQISGIPLNDPASAWDILRQLEDGSVLSATVQRNGAEQNVTLDGTLIVRAEEARSQQGTQAMIAPPGQ